MKKISGLHDIASGFDAMLIDQFGILHDGQKLYPGTLDVLRHLKTAGIRVGVMTNSGKRSDANIARLLKMGIQRDLFEVCVSSGEVAFHNRPAGRGFVIGKDGESYDCGDIDRVGSVAEADVVLILGSNAPATSLDDYREIFAGIRIPAICCNPDKLMLTPQGLQPAPGAIASLYESMGGAVTWIGKPYPGIYHHALSLMGNPRRVLCIGDSPEHDVAGGRAAGLATLLVRQGVSHGMADSALEPQPDFLMEEFRWSASA